MDHDKGMEILNLLKENGVKATFFISGPFLFEDSKYTKLKTADRNRLAMIKQMALDGHEFGNHTVHHWSLFKTEADGSHTTVNNLKDDLSRIRTAWDTMMKAAFNGEQVPANAIMKPYWRAPYGEYGDGKFSATLSNGRRAVLPDTLSLAANAGFPHHFGWNIDVRDTVDSASITPTSMTDSVLAFLKKQKSSGGDSLPSFVILAHLSNGKKWGSTEQGFKRLLTEVRNNGYEWSRLSEIYAFESGSDPVVSPPAETDVAPRFPQWCKIESSDGTANIRVGTFSRAQQIINKKTGQGLTLFSGAGVKVLREEAGWYSVEFTIDGNAYGESTGSAAYVYSGLVHCQM